MQNQQLKLFLSVIVMHKDDEQLIFTDPSTVQKPKCRTISWHCYANAISFANMMNMNSLGAFLTYSTNNSGKGENPDLVREAVKIATERGLNVINGEMQFDSAYDLNVRKAKFPKCSSKRSWSIYFSKPRKL
nr:phosphate acyltransferase [Mycoplasmopsis bovis]